MRRVEYFGEQRRRVAQIGSKLPYALELTDELLPRSQLEGGLPDRQNPSKATLTEEANLFGANEARDETQDVCRKFQ